MLAKIIRHSAIIALTLLVAQPLEPPVNYDQLVLHVYNLGCKEAVKEYAAKCSLCYKKCVSKGLSYLEELKRAIPIQ